MFGFTKNLFSKHTPEEEKEIIYDYKSSQLLQTINKLEFGKEGPINIETSEHRNELDERLSSFIRWSRFNMDKEELLLYSTSTYSELYRIIDCIISKYLHVLPITNNLMKFIAERNKLERIEGDF